MENAIFRLSFRCYYKDGGTCDKWQDLRLAEIPRWIDSYKFTHPSCVAVSVKIWFSDLERGEGK